MPLLPKSESIEIREVWEYNLEEQFSKIMEIVDDYPYIAMDTEFPGIVLRPVGSFKNSNDYHYQTLKDNVDMLKLIQLGLTFSDEQGNLPSCGTGNYCIWQFNFREFNVNDDVFVNDSIELLRQSGIDFKKNNEMGIDAHRFGELLMSSGIVLNDNVYWVTFHSGYDFGYLLKLLTCQNLPETQAGFFDLINMYFPVVYDIKHLMKFCNSLHGGLNKLAELLEVERVGVCHQAGSDSLLTSCTFRKLKENFFSGSLEKYAGVLYGLGKVSVWVSSILFQFLVSCILLFVIASKGSNRHKEFARASTLSRAGGLSNALEGMPISNFILQHCLNQPIALATLISAGPREAKYPLAGCNFSEDHHNRIHCQRCCWD